MDQVKITPAYGAASETRKYREHLAGAGRAILADTIARNTVMGSVAMPDSTWLVALTAFIAEAAGETLYSDDAIKRVHLSVATGYRIIDLLVKEHILEISCEGPRSGSGTITLSEKAFEDFETYVLGFGPNRAANDRHRAQH